MKPLMNEQTEKPTKLSLAPIYHENPFIDNMLGEIKIKRKTQMIKSNNRDTTVMLVNGDGENVGHSAFVRSTEVEEDKFAKLYISQLGALWDLQKTSLKVLSYILSTLKPNDDRVYFDMKECLTYCDWTGTQSVYNGLLALVNAKIIARTEKSHFYYINPSIVFNGSRITIVNTYIKKRKENINPNQKSLVENNDFLEQKD